MQTGTKISGALHGSLVLATIFGGPLFTSDSTQAIQVSEVSVISQSEFLALTAPVPGPIVEAVPEDEPEIPVPPEETLEAVPVPEPEDPPQLQPETPPPVPVVEPEPVPPEDVPDIEPPPEIVVATPEPPEEPEPVEIPDPTDEIVALPEEPAPEPDPEPEVEPEAIPEPEPEPVVVAQPDPVPPPPVVVPPPMPQIDTSPEPEPEVSEDETIIAALQEDMEQLDSLEQQAIQDALTRTRASLSGRLTGEEEEGLKFAIRECWSVPIGIRNDSELKVTLGVELDRDGTVKGTPRLIEPGAIESSEIEQAFNAARRAVMRCQPYELPADKYEQWQRMEIVFNPERMVLR